MKRTIGVVVVVLAAMGCGHTEGTGTETKENPAIANAAPDNTKKNERDQNPSALTPGDQAENETDRTITQQIRQGVVKGDAISLSGKNVKIITVDGVVTLRGPVKTEQEKTDIATLAKGVDGVKRVDNQLEIAAN